MRLKTTLLFILFYTAAFSSDYYVTKSTLNLRDAPSTQSQTIGTIAAGDTIEALEHIDNIWIKLNYKNKIGYCSKTYLLPIENNKTQIAPISMTEEVKEEDSSWYGIFVLILIGVAGALFNLAFYKIGQKRRNKYGAAFLALFFGIWGTHRYYLGQNKKGIVFFLLGWTFIPAIVGIWDAILYTFWSKTYFNNKYQVITSSFKPSENKQKRANDNERNTKKTDAQNLSNKVVDKRMDGSIIDVNNEHLDLSIKQKQQADNIPLSVPYWQHSYVYSYDEIKYASSAQKKFYKYLKSKVLNWEYVDIDGYTNYAFILYFDFLNEYKNHNDIKLLEEQFKLIGQICPKTKRYTSGILMDELRKRNDEYSLNKLKELEDPYLRYQSGYSDYNPYEYRLGSLYKEKLKLETKEVVWLNKIWHTSNVFLSIEGCLTEVIRYYCFILQELEKKWNSEDITNDITGIINSNLIRKSDYFESFESDVYLTIFKIIENCVREKYIHTRKISESLLEKYSSRVQTKFDEFIGNNVREIIESNIYTFNEPSEETLIDLNAQNVTRWKTELNSIMEEFTIENKAQFIDKVKHLEVTNQKNPNIENILFEASKFIAKYDKIQSLKYYAQHIYYDLKSDKFDNRDLTKTVQKSLFQTEEQITDFKQIIADLIETSDLDNALERISNIYTPKRKKIKLDISEIKKVEEKHEGTVELLNGFLESDTNDSIEVIEIVKTSKETSILIPEINIGKVEEELIKRIVENSFVIHQSEVDKYAIENNIFKNQLIDYINEACMEHLDGEALIEEDAENYVIEESYYKEISK